MKLKLIILILLVSACNNQPQNEQPVKIPVRVQTVQMHGEESGIKYSANIIPTTQLNLAFKVNGYINRIAQNRNPDGSQQTITQGNKVTQGMLLATIDDSEYQDKFNKAKANLGSAQAALIKAQQDYKRAKILYAEKSMTAPDYDSAVQEHSSARDNVAGAQAELDQARQNLAYCALKAPMDGVVIKRNIEIGSLVLPGEIAFVLANLETVKVEFSVPDIALKNIKLGKQLSISTRSYPEQTFTGKVTSISPSANQQTRVFDIDITLPNPEQLLKANMVAELQLDKMPSNNAILEIPIDAIVRSQDQAQGYAVYIIQKKQQNSYAKLQNIVPGDIHGNRITILSGLAQQDQVIISGINIVWDGSPVNVID